MGEASLAQVFLPEMSLGLNQTCLGCLWSPTRLYCMTDRPDFYKFAAWLKGNPPSRRFARAGAEQYFPSSLSFSSLFFLAYFLFTLLSPFSFCCFLWASLFVFYEEMRPHSQLYQQTANTTLLLLLILLLTWVNIWMTVFQVIEAFHRWKLSFNLVAVTWVIM